MGNPKFSIAAWVGHPPNASAEMALGCALMSGMDSPFTSGGIDFDRVLDQLHVIVWFLLGIGGIWAASWKLRGNKNWPTAEATIVHATLEPVGSNSWAYTGYYRYSSAGVAFQSRITRSFYDRAQAQMFFTSYPQGKTILVRVKPDEVSISLFREEDNVLVNQAHS